MRLTVPRQALRQLLGSENQLARAWPDHAREVRTLVQTLRLSEPSLAEALGTGLVALDPDEPFREGRLSLGHRSARLSAQALDATRGMVVRDAREYPDHVTWLAVETVAVYQELAS